MNTTPAPGRTLESMERFAERIEREVERIHRLDAEHRRLRATIERQWGAEPMNYPERMEPAALRAMHRLTLGLENLAGLSAGMQDRHGYLNNQTPYDCDDY